MSKRFGRNQRRRARERIAELEQGIAMSTALTADMRRRLDDAREANRRIVDTLDEMSVLKAPQIKRFVDHMLRTAQAPAFLANRFDGAPDAAINETLHFVEHHLRDLTPEVRRELDGALHMYVPLGNGKGVAYRVTEQALQVGRQTFRHCIWPNIVEMLHLAIERSLYGKEEAIQDLKEKTNEVLW